MAPKCMKDEKRNKERNRQRLRRAADERDCTCRFATRRGLKRLSFLPSSMEDATSGERAGELLAGGGAGGEVHSRKRKEAKANHLNGRGSVLPAEQSLRLIDENKRAMAL